MKVEELDRYRISVGPFASNKGDLFGAFFVPNRPSITPLKVICSPFDDKSQTWQHVSVSLPNRTPFWSEMVKVKDLFWEEEDTVLQFHPPKSKYVNNMKFCLHMWKHNSMDFPVPETYLVGIK